MMQDLGVRQLHCLKRHVRLVAMLAGQTWEAHAWARALGTKEDAQQEGYVALCRAAALFDPARGFSFGAYVGTAVYHHLRTVARQRVRHAPPAGDLAPLWRAEPVAPVPGPVEDACRREQVARVRAALGLLDPADQRAVSACHGLDGPPCTARTVALEAGVTAECVRQRRVRGYKQLRTLLAGV